jgi:hypothetical protein
LHRPVAPSLCKHLQVIIAGQQHRKYVQAVEQSTDTGSDSGKQSVRTYTEGSSRVAAHKGIGPRVTYDRGGWGGGRFWLVGGVSNGSVWASGFDPNGRHDDLPLVLCQANQIPKTAIETVKMPKTICMMVSSSIVCVCVEVVGRSVADG